jgi:DNA-binding beta-propeller fold protein YncE
MVAIAQPQDFQGQYRVLKTVRVGGDGGFDWPIADAESGKLYIPRSGTTPHISIFDLNTIELIGEISGVNARTIAMDSGSHTAFSSSFPVAMWDTRTNTVIKTIPIEGRPAGILSDEFNHRIYIQGRSEPGLTVIDAKDGAVLGTIPVGGEIEQSASDGKGTIYVDIEDRQSIVVIDAKAMKIKTIYSLNGEGGRSEGMALDIKNHILFVASREPQVMLMLDADSGKEISELPIGRGCSAVAFNPKTMECFSSQADGTLTVIKENSPTNFTVEQTIKTMPGTKRLSLDPKTGRIYMIAAEFGPAPASAPVIGKPAQGPMAQGSFSIIVVGK